MTEPHPVLTADPGSIGSCAAALSRAADDCDLVQQRLRQLAADPAAAHVDAGQLAEAVATVHASYLALAELAAGLHAHHNTIHELQHRARQLAATAPDTAVEVDLADPSLGGNVVAFPGADAGLSPEAAAHRTATADLDDALVTAQQQLRRHLQEAESLVARH